MPDTRQQYESIINRCLHLFEQKTADYGTAWRILRLSSITDQIFIKAKRIRSIQEKGTQLVADDLRGEFVGIINYAVMALIQIELADSTVLELPVGTAVECYKKNANETKELMFRKNHDYGEAWRDMRVSSITDIILMKLLRTKQIEDNQGVTLVSEGVAANYQDMINYAIFALILMEENPK
jgi:Nucleotide modification associated domain 1